MKIIAYLLNIMNIQRGQFYSYEIMLSFAEGDHIISIYTEMPKTSIVILKCISKENSDVYAFCLYI